MRKLMLICACLCLVGCGNLTKKQKQYVPKYVEIGASYNEFYTDTIPVEQHAVGAQVSLTWEIH